DALGVGDKASDLALPVAGEAVPLRLRWKEARRALRLHRGLHPDLNPRGRGSPARSSQVREPERPGRGHQHGLPAASAAWSEKLGLTFPLMSDFARTALEAYDFLDTDPKSRLYRYAKPASVIIDN